MFLIALGSNIPGAVGGPQAVLEAALNVLAERGIEVVEQSSWWRTPAYPAGSGPDFVNAAARVAAPLKPEQMLVLLHEVETSLGRLRPHRWAPRVCDIDLLAAENMVLPDRATVEAWMRLDPAEQAQRTPDQLLLPHPRLHERAFVLAPLAEVARDWRHPLLGTTVREMREALSPMAFEGVTRIGAPG